MQNVTIKIRGKTLNADLAKRPVTIGRHSDATIIIGDDNLLSRLHCRLEASPQGVVLRDLNSRNGTWVNGRKIDTVMLGQTAAFNIGNVQVEVVCENVPSGDVLDGSSLDSAKAVDDLAAFDVPELIDDDLDASPAAAPARRPSPANTVFKKGEYGFQSIYQLATVGADTPGSFGPEQVEMLNARGGVIHAASSPKKRGKKSGATANTLDQLRLMLLGCVRSGASDIHLEPKRSGGQLRLRIDGAMVHICELDPEDTKRLMSMVKILCDIDISQQGAIQEGHFSSQVPGRRIDYRVSYTPAMNGQKMVIRVLDPYNAPQTLHNLGLPEWMLKRVDTLARQDTGMMLVCGPTGSGKTTTLYATLRQIDVQSRNIITIEDPVEYEIPGVTQMPINSEQGATFLSLLRSSLRQDPDVVVLGEVRDKDTAVTAMQAATTGHMVLSTIHAKDTLGIIFRLLDLQVEPYLIASTLNILVAQRLVRRLCPKCKQPVNASATDLIRLGVEPGSAPTLYQAGGCPHCFNTGYHGRCGVFEMLVLTDSVRDLILSGAGVAELRSQLKAGQFESLLDSARKHVLAGQTTIEEVERTVGFGDL